jgi:hypothetical protein
VLFEVQISIVSPYLPEAPTSRKYRMVLLLYSRNDLNQLDNKRPISILHILSIHTQVIVSPYRHFSHIRDQTKPNQRSRTAHSHSHQPEQSFSRALGSNLDPRNKTPRALQEKISDRKGKLERHNNGKKKDPTIKTPRKKI